jgi:ribosome biogenesis ATPase
LIVLFFYLYLNDYILSISNNPDENESDDSTGSIDEHALSVAIKGENMNEINNMITSMYKSNNKTNDIITKSNLKTNSMFDPPTAENSIPSNKKVHFSNEPILLNNNNTEPINNNSNNYNSEYNNKRKLNESNKSNSSLQKNIKLDQNERNINQLADQQKRSSSNYNKSQNYKTKDLIESQINFDMFACDQDLKEMIFKRIYYILSPEHFQSNGKTPPRGFLLHGPPGTGKTQLVYAIAGELKIPLLKVTSTELISGVSGESEENIRFMFEKAIRNAPCILFIDEIEAISQRRETASKNMEHRIVTQLLACFDDLAVKSYVPIVVIGATNQADSLDIGLRRAGRFDQEIPIGIPDEKQRKKILEILCSKIKKNPDLDIEKIVLNTPGYVGADLNALIDEALISALDRKLTNQINESNHQNKEFILNLIEWIKHKLDNLKIETSENDNTKKYLEQIEISQNDFDIAISRVKPSSKREGFATVPDVSWDDIGALQNVREELKIAVLAPVKYARQCEIFNFTKPPGILMVGPPGCGKTLLAKAIAKESGVNFISVKGPELLNMYVGESERAVRSLFQRARNSKPCVIFFDEIDAICAKRSDSGSDNGATTRVVNQMLTEMDGLESRKGVFLMAASNRPDIVDPAILRPGRLDKIIYVGLPNSQDKFEILKTITKVIFSLFSIYFLN